MGVIHADDELVLLDDALNAGLSAAGMLPLIGNAVVGGRVIKGGLKEVHTAADASLRRLADGGLVTHELAPGFHTIARHVGLSEADLLARVTGPGRVGTASTFATHAGAERYTYASLAAHVPKIEAWVRAGAPMKLKIVTHFDHPVGKSM